MQLSSARRLAKDDFASLLALFPDKLDLDALALETKAIQRRRAIRSGADLLRLGLAWGPGDCSLQEAAAWSGLLGFARLTDEALVQRLHRGVGFFEAITAHLLRAAGEASRWTGRSLRVCDSTSLSGPASEGTDWRVHGVFDLGTNRFSHLELTDGRGGEALDRGDPVPGEIRIADRGYSTANSWARFLDKSAGRADVIVRLRWSTVRFRDEHGKPFDLVGWLDGLPHAVDTHDHAVLVWTSHEGRSFPVRVIAKRKTPEEIAKTLDHLRRQASRKQHRINPNSEIAARYIVLATTLPQADFPAEEVLAAYRLRWQIELAFKRLKSLLHIAKLKTRTDAGTRCWLHAHLNLALLCDDQTQDVLRFFP